MTDLLLTVLIFTALLYASFAAVDLLDRRDGTPEAYRLPSPLRWWG